METLMLIIDTVGVGLVLYWSMKNDRKPEGTPEEGWVRIGDPVAEPVEPRRRGARGPVGRTRRL